MIYGIRYAPESLFRLRWEPPNRFPRGTGFVPVAPPEGPCSSANQYTAPAAVTEKELYGAGGQSK